MSITEVKKYDPNGGRARATGGGGTEASNPPRILWVLDVCFTECFTAGLPVGNPNGPDGPKGGNPTQKKPQQSGEDRRGSGGRQAWDMYIYPGGLTIPLYCPD